MPPRQRHFVHNPRGELLDLSRLKPPIRDKRRLTWGYHIMNSKIEVLETSRGCTRNCSFCSMQHMYGRSFRTFPIERVLADIDDIYYNRKTRWIFVADDNLVLDTERVIKICDAIIARQYRKLNLIVQADCITMSRNEEMVRKMAMAGIKSVFLGIENVSKKNLAMAHKGNIVDASRKAMELCHKYGIMVVGGLIFGFPDDDETAIIENYQFLKSIGSDTAYCQILTPYPKTVMRQELLDQGLVTNPNDYKWYNGIWANVKTRHLGRRSVAISGLVSPAEGDGLVGTLRAHPKPGPFLDIHLVIRISAHAAVFPWQDPEEIRLAGPLPAGNETPGRRECVQGS